MTNARFENYVDDHGSAWGGFYRLESGWVDIRFQDGRYINDAERNGALLSDVIQAIEQRLVFLRSTHERAGSHSPMLAQLLQNAISRLELCYADVLAYEDLVQHEDLLVRD